MRAQNVKYDQNKGMRWQQEEGKKKKIILAIKQKDTKSHNFLPLKVIYKYLYKDIVVNHHFLHF